MLERILMPLDGSEIAEISLPYGEELAAKLGAEIVLYHVRGRDQAELEHVHKVYLTTVAGNAKKTIGDKNKGAKVTVEIESGEPAQNICDLVEKNKIDLIIMTAVSASGLKMGKMLGSVTDHVCHIVPVPVMVVRPQNAKRLRGKKQVFNNLLISLDGSQLSRRALPVGEELAAGLKIPITLFEMVPMVYPSTNYSNLYGSDYVRINDRDEQVIEYNYAKANEAEESRVRVDLIEIERDLKEKGITSDHKITSGIDAAKEILQVSKEAGADLIVMSTHGRSGLERWLLGSVTEKVLRYGNIPLLLVNARAG